MSTEFTAISLVAKTHRTSLGALLLGAAVALAGCGKANGENGKDEKDEVPAVPVEVATTQRAEMAALYTGTAPIERL